MATFAEFENEIYLGGLLGTRPDLPFGWRDLEAAAHAAMTPEAAGYVGGSAGAEDTFRANREAFDRWRIVPRMLRGVPAQRDHTTELFATTMPAPVLLAPVGVLSIVHPDAEPAVARAAAALGLPMVVSTASSTPMEDVAAAAPDAPRWYQLYWPREREIARSFVARAERAGYTALVVTLDTWQLGWRPRDLDTAYLPFLRSVGIANYLTDPAFLAGLEKTPAEDPMAAVLRFVGVFTNPGLTWADLAWLREQTTLPIIVKGIQHPEDVALAREAGVDGIVCSNHGGRQVDGAVASLDMLPALVAAAADLPVLFDSGIRSGADAVKALALGASAVLLGRPFVWGLALAGERGVTHVLRSFLADFDLQLGLAGYASVDELSPGALIRG